MSDIVNRLRRAANHPHKGPYDTDVTMLIEAARRIKDGYPAGGQWTTQTVRRVLLEVAHIIDTQPGPKRAAPCPDHKPVQHRDARPPWCNTCGLTEGGEVPTGPLDRRNRS